MNSPLAPHVLPALLCLRPAKRSGALLGSNPARNNRAAAHFLRSGRGWLATPAGQPFFAHFRTKIQPKPQPLKSRPPYALKNPGGFGGQSPPATICPSGMKNLRSYKINDIELLGNISLS